jgi:hypothetical protein
MAAVCRAQRKRYGWAVTLLPKSLTVAFRVEVGEDGLLSELDARGDQRGVVARRDLGRYYDILAQALQRVTLSPAEAHLLADLADEALSDHRLLWAAVANAVRDQNVAVRHRVEDIDVLVRRLRELEAVESCALVDALERVGRARQVSGAGSADLELLLRRVGVVRE